MKKTCTACGFPKDAVNDFYACSTSKDGVVRRYGRCKTCHNQRGMQSYWKKKDEISVQNKRRRESKKSSDPIGFAKREAEKTTAWRAANPEADKVISTRAEKKRRPQKRLYRQANTVHIKARSAEYRERNRESIRAQNREYYAANSELILAKLKQYRQAFPERDRETHRRWKRANKDKVNAITHRRRCRLAESKENYTVPQWNLLKDLAGHLCQCCGKTEPEVKLTLDHIKPVAHAGHNGITNIQLLCFGCNNTKNDSEVDYRPEGFLDALLELLEVAGELPEDSMRVMEEDGQGEPLE